MNYKSLFLLGRQPAIGRAELESLFGADHLVPIGDCAVGSDIPLTDIQFERLGSIVRVSEQITVINTVPWTDVIRIAIKQLPTLLTKLPAEGKIKLGISTFGFDTSSEQLLRAGLEAKKALKKHGRSVRVVPNTELALNTAQVLHNSLTGDLGIELLCINDGSYVYIAQTVAVQNITAYAKRDQERPKRDARVGMLPPKLAQTIVNLGVGSLQPSPSTTILDPFCGTGVILQESLLMGYAAYGTDLEPRMIDYTQENIAWLSTHGIDPDPYLEVGDATTHQWTHPITAIACETYLGRPLSHWPTPDKLQEIKGNCNVIVQKFLQNLASQIQSGTRLCLAVPAWVAPNGRIHHLAVLDQLESLGYNRISFVWANTDEMVYRRPDQLVARELIVITRK